MPVASPAAVVAPVARLPTPVEGGVVTPSAGPGGGSASTAVGSPEDGAGSADPPGSSAGGRPASSGAGGVPTSGSGLDGSAIVGTGWPAPGSVTGGSGWPTPGSMTGGSEMGGTGWPAPGSMTGGSGWPTSGSGLGGTGAGRLLGSSGSVGSTGIVGSGSVGSSRQRQRERRQRDGRGQAEDVAEERRCARRVGPATGCREHFEVEQRVVGCCCLPVQHDARRCGNHGEHGAAYEPCHVISFVSNVQLGDTPSRRARSHTDGVTTQDVRPRRAPARSATTQWP